MTEQTTVPNLPRFYAEPTRDNLQYVAATNAITATARHVAKHSTGYVSHFWDPSAHAWVPFIAPLD